MEQTLLLLQLSDSAFPTGGFSHSLGLESAAQHQQILNTKDLKNFIICLLENAGSFNLPFVRESHCMSSDPEALTKLDHLCHVSTANHIANRASTRQVSLSFVDSFNPRAPCGPCCSHGPEGVLDPGLQQGKSLLDTASKVYGCDDIYSLVSRLKHCHYPVVFGAVYGALGLSLDATLTAFMSGVIRTAVASAVRLDKIGPIEAQKIIAEVQQLIPGIMDRNKSRSAEDACITFPVPDVLQNCHDKLFSKLFYS